MIRKLPYMPFYGNDFIRKTIKLTPEERWIYVHLIWLMWNNGGALDDIDADNARAVGLTLRRWKTIKARLVGYLDFSQGQFSQNRLREVLNEVTQIADKRRHAGIAGSKARWEGYQILTNGKGNAFAINSDGKQYGKTMPGKYGKRYGKTIASSNKKDITTTLQDAPREEESQMAAGLAAAPDGAARPSDPEQGIETEAQTTHPLLETEYMKRARLKA